MIPELKKSGLLPAGVYTTTWAELEEKLGTNHHRQVLLSGLKRACQVLYQYGCREIYIGGSFVTAEPEPGDIDVCYNNDPMNWKAFIKNHPEFKVTRYGIAAQKKKYGSEFHAFNSFEDYILQFFQFDKNNNPKGIVKLSLSEPMS